MAVLLSGCSSRPEGAVSAVMKGSAPAGPLMSKGRGDKPSLK